MNVANPLLTRCRRLFHQQLQRELSVLLHQLDQTTELTIRVPQLALDLGEITLDQFDRVFLQKLLTALTLELRLWIVETASERPAKRFTATDQLPSKALEASIQKKHLDAKPKTEVTRTLLSCFASYLETGVATAPFYDHLTHSAQSGLLLEFKTQPGSWRRLLGQHCLRFPSLPRLLHGFESGALGKICCLLFDSETDWPAQSKPAWAYSLILGALLAQTQQAPSRIPAPNRVELAHLLPDFKLSSLVLPLLARELEQLCSHLPSPALASWLHWLCRESGQWQHLKHHLSNANRRRLKMLGQNNQELKNKKPFFLTGDSLTLSTDQAPTGTECRLRQLLKDHSQHQQLQSAESSRLKSETLPVSNSGLVLLWPLLPGLFRSLGLLKDGRFLSLQLQKQTVCWLDDWLWGDMAQAEWRTPLTKLLCGLPLDTSLFPWPEPNKIMMTALEKLLSTLPEQVSALKRCDADTIRQWFLHRPGKLSYQDRRWKLQVERDSCDVLLVNLPWPKNQLLLPWLESRIEISWD